jgi:KDO2-lipid IV(A) lauroyltransferase
VGKREADAAARRVFRNFAKYIIDFYQLPSLGRDSLRQRIRFDEWQALDEALNDDANGTIFVTLHLGQAELGGAALSSCNYPVNVIADTLEYAPMNEFVQSLRRALGMKIIPAKKAKPGILRCLARDEVLALMFDATEAGEGITVDLLGAPAQVSSAPARIALRSGVRVLPAVVRRDVDDPRLLVPRIDFDFQFVPTGDHDSDVLAMSQALARSFEGFIREAPDQWFAFRPVWPAGATLKEHASGSDDLVTTVAGRP